jgi:DNA-binding transcriptional LysR family regulator
VQLSDRIGRRIKLQDLHVLMAVVHAGSMGKAARVLNTSQPNISKSIADLEHVLGVSLLDRHRQGVEPTDYGRALIDCGATVFDELRQGVKNIEFLADPEAGVVRIGCIPPLAASFVTAVIDRLSRRYPRITFELLNAGTTSLHRDLHDRNVDLLIARKLDASADEREEFEFLFEDPYVVVAGARHPWARRRTIKSVELMEGLWVLPPADSPPGLLALEAFQAAGLVKPRVAVVAVTPQVRMSLLATGRYLTIFSSSALRFPIRHPDLKVLPVELPLARPEIGVVTLKNRSLTPVAKLFVEYARRVARPLANKR